MIFVAQLLCARRTVDAEDISSVRHRICPQNACGFVGHTDDTQAILIQGCGTRGGIFIF